MAATDAVTLALLDKTAIAGALALSEEAGWNQLAEDWQVFLRGGSVFGAREGGRLIATGATLPYDGFGWVSMVLTTKDARGRGIGTDILRRCIAALQASGCVPVLDATPQGERIYRPLGFEPVLALTRWRGAAADGAPPPGIRPATEADLPAIIAADTVAFGARREALVRSLFARAPHVAFVSDAGGFVLGRPGRTAVQLGPLTATGADEALGLLEAALGAASGPLLIDVRDGRGAIENRLAGAGFIRERPFLRMAHGRREPFGDPAHLFAIAGPELG